MQIVKHKMFGIGEVISREKKEIGAYITVRFENGKEMRFAIPESFTLGVVTAEGALKEEVEQAIIAMEVREQERSEERRAAIAAAAASAPSVRHGRTPTTPINTRGSIELAFEEYLVNAGYREHTDAGNPSTVFAYVHAIKKVMEEEGLSWYALQDDIVNIVGIYNVGGEKEHIGAKSKCTVINALKRFREFVNG